VLFGFVLVFICISIGGQPTTQPERPISLHDVAERGINGRLGVRLGTIVEVAGQVVPNSSNSKAELDAPFSCALAP
jgi:hypothetical protein